MVSLEGIVESITFRNEDNGYTVCRIRADKELITAVGVVPYIYEQHEYKVEGEWVVHPKFGKQLQVQSFDEIIPTTVLGIEKYLASGVIEGIGKVTAKK